MWADIRIACRGVARNKGFAIAGAATLALGIAATTTIFSVVYGVLLRPLPYPDASRLVVIQGEKSYVTGARIMNFSAPELEPFAAAASVFSSIAMTHVTMLTYRDDTGVASIPSATVSGQFFMTLGTTPLLGRALADESEPNIVISERLWRRLFAASPHAIGRSIRLTGWQNTEHLYTIVGVMPHAFQYPHASSDVWKPLGFVRAMNEERVRELVPGGRAFIARIKDGVTFEAARSEAARVVDTVLKPHFTTSRTDLYARVTRLSDEVVGSIGPALWILMGTVMLVLLVACANVANLILARQSTRVREISVRLALGARRGRLVAYLLVEVAALAAAGAVLGVLASAAAIRGLQWLQPAQLPRLDAIRVDVPVMLFAALVAVSAVMIAGLIPALIATRHDAGLAITSGSRGSVSAGKARQLRAGLIVVEIAISIVLIVGAVLLSRSLVALMRVDVGVNTENVIAANVSLAMGRNISPERQVQIANDLEDRIAALPSVRSAGFGSGVPPTGEYMRVSFTLSNGKTTESHMVTAVPASPGYFSTLQIRLLRGRWFSDADAATAPKVAILNREAATRFFPNDDPIGRTQRLMGAEVTVVGVVENVKYTGLASRPEGVIYLPFAQQPMPISVVLARTDGDPLAIASQVRDIIRGYDADISVPQIQTLTWWMSNAAAQPRLRALLISLIAAITVVLAMVGLYGLMSYSIVQRTTEIGVRMAVGAQHADVMRLVLGEGARLAIGGIALGLGAAWWSTRLLAAFLYGVTATDMATFAVVAVCLLFVALLATAVPAWRAARIDPASALRAE